MRKDRILRRIILETLEDMENGGTVTLFHGLSNMEKLKYVVGNGGFTPKVCAEGGGKWIYFSIGKPLGYSLTFKFTVPKSELGNWMSGARFTYETDNICITKNPVSLDEYGCELYSIPGMDFGDFCWYPEGFNLEDEKDARSAAVCAGLIEPFNSNTEWMVRENNVREIFNRTYGNDAKILSYVRRQIAAHLQ